MKKTLSGAQSIENVRLFESFFKFLHGLESLSDTSETQCTAPKRKDVTALNGI